MNNLTIKRISEDIAKLMKSKKVLLIVIVSLTALQVIQWLIIGLAPTPASTETWVLSTLTFIGSITGLVSIFLIASMDKRFYYFSLPSFLLFILICGWQTQWFLMLAMFLLLVILTIKFINWGKDKESLKIKQMEWKKFAYYAISLIIVFIILFFVRSAIGIIEGDNGRFLNKDFIGVHLGDALSLSFYVGGMFLAGFGIWQGFIFFIIADIVFAAMYFSDSKTIIGGIMGLVFMMTEIGTMLSWISRMDLKEKF